MIDTHVHLDFESYDADREKVIQRFFENGGRAIVNIGVDEERINKSLQIAQMDKRIFAAIGFHPQEGTDLFRNTKSVNYLSVLKKHAQNKKVVAIGEIGLDYFHPSGKEYDLKINDEIKAVQKVFFVDQLKMARKLGLPVIIHSWEAEEDCWTILKDYLDLSIVFHCYGRGIELEFTEKLLKHENIYFSFTGNITYPKPGKAGSEILEHLKLIPLERMMVETDGPFLAPVPHRGKRNEPSYVKYIIEKIADIKGIRVEEVEKQTDKNAINYFGLDF